VSTPAGGAAVGAAPATGGAAGDTAGAAGDTAGAAGDTAGAAGDTAGAAGETPAASASALDRVAGTPPRLAPGDRVLLLGIGNDLRGDDAAGPGLVRALESRVPWDVRVAHGLTPELADDLARCDVALFVDASADPSLDAPTWTRHPSDGVASGRRGAEPPGVPGAPPLLGHALDVPALLALTSMLHGRAPRAATLALPAREFDLGERLSATAAVGVWDALAHLTRLARG
jgi:hydrogenase maturation protease